LLYVRSFTFGSKNYCGRSFSGVAPKGQSQNLESTPYALLDRELPNGDLLHPDLLHAHRPLSLPPHLVRAPGISLTTEKRHVVTPPAEPLREDAGVVVQPVLDAHESVEIQVIESERQVGLEIQAA